MDLITYIPFAALGISIVSLYINVHNFIQGPKFRTSLNTIVLLKLDESYKRRIILEILVDNLFSSKMSDFVARSHTQLPELQNAVRNKDRELAALIFQIHLQNLDSNKIQYNLEIQKEEVIKYIGHKAFETCFYLPLNILNLGRRSGEISSIFLKVRKKGDRNKLWYFNCTSEIDPDVFFKNTKEKIANHEFSKRLFPGVCIQQSSVHRLDCWMINSNEIFEKQLTQDVLDTGTYYFQVIGYNSKKKICLKSNVNYLNIDENMFIQSFSGNNQSRMLSFVSHIEADMNNVES